MSFDDLVERYYRDVYAYTLSRTHHMQTAEDVTQDVFTRALAAWPRYREQNCPKHWLLQITKNLLRDRARKQHVIKFEALAEDAEERIPDSRFTQPEEAAIRRENLEETRRMARVALGALSQDSAKIVMDYYTYDDQTANLASERGINRNTIKSRLYRARTTMRARVIDENAHHAAGEEGRTTR